MPVRFETFTQAMRDGRWRLESLHSDDDHVLIWFTKGQGRIVAEGTTRIYGPNAVVFLPARTCFSIEAKTGLFGQIARIRETDAITMPRQTVHLRIRDLLEHGEFVALFENMQREAGSERVGSERACAYYAALLGVWLERQAEQSEVDTPRSAAEKLARRYSQLLEVRYASGANVADMAAELGVTPTHLTRCCRQACGRSAHDMLSERLMYEARDLLKKTKLPINRIATDLGYRSAAYFTRAFQNQVGQSPSDFRELR